MIVSDAVSWTNPETKLSFSVTVDDKTYSFYDIQEVIYSLNEVPFQWKLQQINQDIKFIMQYTTIVDTNNIATQLSDVFGINVLVELDELFPIESFTKNPSHSKSAYIEKKFS